jgi:tRNA pseudouridine38-40 synthase
VERYKVIVAYDGTDFAGFQIQAGARTVQAVLEDALRELGWSGKHLLAAGRTDSGVHALGQVVAFDCEWPHPAEALRDALNARMPASIRIRRASTAGPAFHPRYSARWRTYRYRLIESPLADPLAERYAWRLWPALDREALARASAALVGERDFAAFGSAPRRGGVTVRRVTRAEWREAGEGFEFTVTANAFLYRMVRMLVGSLVRVGQGRRTAGEFAELIAAIGNRHGGPAAPARGLCLMHIDYEEAAADEGQPSPGEPISEMQ